MGPSVHVGSPQLLHSPQPRPQQLRHSHLCYLFTLYIRMEHGYKEAKEAFVSGTSGSTVLHINMISVVALVRPSFTLSQQHVHLIQVFNRTTLSPSHTLTPNALHILSNCLVDPCATPSLVYDALRECTGLPLASSPFPYGPSFTDSCEGGRLTSTLIRAVLSVVTVARAARPNPAVTSSDDI